MALKDLPSKKDYGTTQEIAYVEGLAQRSYLAKHSDDDGVVAAVYDPGAALRKYLDVAARRANWKPIHRETVLNRVLELIAKLDLVAKPVGFGG